MREVVRIDGAKGTGRSHRALRFALEYRIRKLIQGLELGFGVES